jgi:hypothetical protein
VRLTVERNSSRHSVSILRGPTQKYPGAPSAEEQLAMDVSAPAPAALPRRAPSLRLLPSRSDYLVAFVVTEGSFRARRRCSVGHVSCAA